MTPTAQAAGPPLHIRPPEGQAPGFVPIPDFLLFERKARNALQIGVTDLWRYVDLCRLAGFRRHRDGEFEVCALQQLVGRPNWPGSRSGVDACLRRLEERARLIERGTPLRWGEGKGGCTVIRFLAERLAEIAEALQVQRVPVESARRGLRGLSVPFTQVPISDPALEDVAPGEALARLAEHRKHGHEERRSASDTRWTRVGHALDITRERVRGREGENQPKVSSPHTTSTTSSAPGPGGDLPSRHRRTQEPPHRKGAPRRPSAPRTHRRDPRVESRGDRPTQAPLAPPDSAPPPQLPEGCPDLRDSDAFKATLGELSDRPSQLLARAASKAAGQLDPACALVLAQLTGESLRKHADGKPPIEKPRGLARWLLGQAREADALAVEEAAAWWRRQRADLEEARQRAERQRQREAFAAELALAQEAERALDRATPECARRAHCWQIDRDLLQADPRMRNLLEAAAAGKDDDRQEALRALARLSEHAPDLAPARDRRLLSLAYALRNEDLSEFRDALLDLWVEGVSERKAASQLVELDQADADALEVEREDLRAEVSERVDRLDRIALDRRDSLRAQIAEQRRGFDAAAWDRVEGFAAVLRKRREWRERKQCREADARGYGQGTADLSALDPDEWTGR